MERAQELWQEEGLPELKLKEPIWCSKTGKAGYWSDEDEQKAQLATKGEYYKTGEKQARERIPARPHYSLFDK
jgi:hypothetical protein